MNFLRKCTNNLNYFIPNHKNNTKNLYLLNKSFIKGFFKTKNNDDDFTEEKYKILQIEYYEQSNRLELMSNKFDEISEAYINKVKESEQIKLRYEKEILITKEYAISKFAKDTLDVFDNFGRAMVILEGKEFSSLPKEKKVELFRDLVEGKLLLFII